MNSKKANLKQKRNDSSNKIPGSKLHVRTVADNRKARFNFEIIETIEAGLQLTGTEIKSIRAGKVNIRDAFAQVRNGEMWIHHLHIASWASGGRWNHDPVRIRKLLLHTTEIERFSSQATQKGLTLVALRIYIKGHHAKVELALAKGRRRYDKRKVIMQRETDREIARVIRKRQY